MADSDRVLFAASSADYGVLTNGAPDPSAIFEVYDAISGGSHITDLQKADHTPETNVHVDVDDSTFRFYGPEFFRGSLWIEGAGGKRFEAKPTGLAERIIDLENLIEAEIDTRTLADVNTLSNANSYADDVVANHESKTNPHPQYVYFIETATGLPSTRKHYVGQTFPAPTFNPAPSEGDLLDFLS